MWEVLHQAAKSGWIGKAESAAEDLTFDYFVMAFLAFTSVTIFVCWCLIINLQLYQMLPGWGPIRKFDSDGTEEMRINQLLMHEEKQGIGHKGKRNPSVADENIAFLQGVVGSAHGEMTGLLEEAKRKAKQDGLEAHPDDDLEQEGGEGDAEVQYGKINDNGLYNGFQESYGTIGECTWGYCESPNQWGETRWDPRLQREVVMRHGFADTQWMRAHSRSWARDEPYHMQLDGIRPGLPRLDDQTATQIQQRMVIERGGY